MWPDRVSNPGPPTYESGALPIALRGPACISDQIARVRRYDKWQNKMLIMFVCAVLTLTPHAQVYLCLRCYHKFMQDKDGILIFSTYDEFKHPSIFGVCALFLILLRINKQKTLLSSSHFVFCSVFFIK